MPLLEAAKGVAMCCRRAGVVGIVGAVLVFLGLIHMVSGVYFMLVLPMFQLGSNIWTGAWCALCGAIVGVIGWKQQTLRKGQIILVASLSVLVVEVANLVIIQVGEYKVFLSEKDLKIIVEGNQDLTMKIAFWLTTVVTALGIVVSFFGAQYLFCVVVRGPRVKGRMPVTRSLSEEDLHHRQVHITRYQPPSLVTDSSRVELNELAVRTLGNGSRHVHEFSNGGGGDDSGNSSSSPKPLQIVISNDEGNASSDRDSQQQLPQASSSPDPGETSEQLDQQQAGPSSSKKQTPRTHESVPYFLRNHRSAWQFILPEVVKELKMTNRFSMAESFTNETHSRTSTLSRASKSSFQPHRPIPFNHNNSRPDILDVGRRLSAVNRDCESPNGPYRGGPPSSCSTSLYSIPGTCGRSGSKSPSGHSKVVRPTVPPPAPPPVSNNSAALRESSSGGWKSCSVRQYPAQAGGGFVVDLD